jgi:hypothetical protein
LEKVAESLRLQRSPAYISSLLSSHFAPHNYHLLLRLNESYDATKNAIDALAHTLLSSFRALLQERHGKEGGGGEVRGRGGGRGGGEAGKISYGIFKSKFVGSLKIEVIERKVLFPQLRHIASFLPWVYSDRSFSEGTHELKISSLRYPMVPNAGFAVLPEQDIDTYPYSFFKSLFSREGKVFRKVRGEHIDQVVAQSTVLTLRLQLGPAPRALLFDSQLLSEYECELPAGKGGFRLGLYGCGWAAEVIQLT